MYKKIPCTFAKFGTSNDVLVPVKIRVMHDKINKNSSAFTVDAIEKAKESIKNIPILAYINYEDDDAMDFGGHDVDIKLKEVDGSYKITERYREYPVGIVPESTQVTYETIDDKIYLCCTGYLFKGYSNETVELLKETDGKSVSMEINVNNGYMNEDTGAYQITDFIFRAITILGDDIPPAMENCRIDFYSDEKYSNLMQKFMCELNALLEEREVYEMEENQIVEEVVETVEEVSQETVPTSEEFTEEVSQETKEEPVEETVEEFEAKEKEDDETEKEEDKEKEDDEDEEFKKKRRCSQEEFSLECFKVFFEEVPATVVEVCSLLEEKFNALSDELKVLKEFKANYDQAILNNEVEEIVSEFTFTDEEVTELKEKALKCEISTKEFKKELFALEGMRMHNEKKKFSTEKEVKSNTKINVLGGATEYEPYGGLFSKYKK